MRYASYILLYIVKQLLQNELENSDSTPLIIISRIGSGVQHSAFSFMAEKNVEKSLGIGNMIYKQNPLNSHMP